MRFYFHWLLPAALSLSLPTSAQTLKGNISPPYNAEHFGYSLYMPTPNTCAISAPTDMIALNDKTGQVCIYDFSANTWTLRGDCLKPRDFQGALGWSIAMPNANTIALGDPRYTNPQNQKENAGKVQVFEWNGKNWAAKGNALIGEKGDDFLGFSVAMPNLTTLAVSSTGSSKYKKNGGMVQIYTWNGKDWVQKGLDIEGWTNSNFGFSIHMPDDKTIAIGAPVEEQRGFARVYTWNGKEWEEKGSAIKGEKQNFVGYAVRMPNANTLAVSAPGDITKGQDAGLVEVYTWNGRNWAGKGQSIYGDAAWDSLGMAIDMPNPDLLAVSLMGKGEEGKRTGQVRLYAWDKKTKQWLVKNEINGQDPNSSFGKALHMPDAKTLIIGTPQFKGSSTMGKALIYTFDK